MPEDTIFRIIISLHLAATAQNSIHALETGAARRWNKFLICGHAGVDTVFSRQQLNTFRLKTALSSKSCVALKNNTKEFPRPVENLCHSFARRKNEFLFLPPPSFSSPTFLFLAEINFHSINLAARSRVFQPRQITKIRKMCYHQNFVRENAKKRLVEEKYQEERKRDVFCERSNKLTSLFLPKFSFYF